MGSPSSSRRRLRTLSSTLQPHRDAPTARAAAPPSASAAACAAGGRAEWVSTQLRLEALASAFDGRVALYARHLGTGETHEIAPDATMPTASLIKVPILGATMHRVEQGSLGHNHPVVFSERNCLGQSNEFWAGGVPQTWEPYDIGDDLFARFRDGAEIELSKLITLMLSFSDNYASLCCQDLAGGGSEINRWLIDAAGCRVTRVNSRTRDRDEERRRWGWGQTTAREMMELTVAMTHLSPDGDENVGSTAAGGNANDATDGKDEERTHQAQRQLPLGVEARHEMRRLLSRSFWAREGLSAVPATVAVASKQGAVDRSRSEVAVVCADPQAPAGQGEYAYCVITAEQADERWVAENEGNVLLREVAAVLWSRWGGELAGAGALPSPTGRFALETGAE